MRLFLFFGCYAILLNCIDQTDAQAAQSIVGYRAACSTYNRFVTATPAVLCSYCNLYGTTTVVGKLRCTSRNNVCYTDFEGTPEQFAVGQTQIPTLTNIGTSGVVVPCSAALGVGSTLTGPQILASSLGTDLSAYSFTLVNSSVARLLDTTAFPSPILFNTATGQLALTGTDPGVDVTYTYALTLLDRNTGAVSAPVYLTVRFLTCRLNVACTSNRITVCASLLVAPPSQYTGFSCRVTNQNFPYAATDLSWDFNGGAVDCLNGRAPTVVTSSDGNTLLTNSILSSVRGGVYGVGCLTVPPGGGVTQLEQITVELGANPQQIPYLIGTTQVTVTADPSPTCTSLAAVAS